LQGPAIAGLLLWAAEMSPKSMLAIRVAIGILLGSLLGHAQTCDDIRKVDFRNATIHSAPFDDNELAGLFNGAREFNFQFKDGTADLYIRGHDYKDGTPEARAKIVADSVLDIPGGPRVRFLQIDWEHLKGTGSFTALLGLACSNGEIKHIFQFSADNAKFAEGPGDQIVIEQGIWSQKDAHCCPSQRRTIYYGWNVDQQKFQRLRVDGPDPTPERP
jgi:hypothetical protein